MSKDTKKEKPLNIKELSLLEDSQYFMNRSIEALNLQARRLESYDFEQKNAPWEYLADVHFYITALKRLRQSILVGKKIDKIRPQIENAIHVFDETFSGLMKMRDILEHVDEYIQNKGRHRSVKNSQLYTILFSKEGIEWAELKFCRKTSKAAATELVGKYKRIISQEFREYKEDKKDDTGAG